MTQRASYYRDNGQASWDFHSGDFVTTLQCHVRDDGVARWSIWAVHYRGNETSADEPVEMDRAGARLVLEDWGVCKGRAAAMRERHLELRYRCPWCGNDCSGECDSTSRSKQYC